MWPCRNGFFSPRRLKHSLSEKLWKYNECLKTSQQRWRAPVRCLTNSKQHKLHPFRCLNLPGTFFRLKTAQFRHYITKGKIKSTYSIYKKAHTKSWRTTLTIKLDVSKVWFVLFLEDTVLPPILKCHVE